MSRGLNFILPPSALILRRRGETIGDQRYTDQTVSRADCPAPTQARIKSSTSIRIALRSDAHRQEDVIAFTPCDGDPHRRHVR